MSDDDSRYHDVFELSLHHGTGVFRDFDGLASRDEVFKICEVPETETNPPKYVWDLVCEEPEIESLLPAIRDITLNIIFEQLDLTEHKPTWDEAFQVANTVHELLTVRKWLKVKDF